MQVQDHAAGRVGAALARLGATVTETLAEGTFLFTMDGIEGLARQRRGKFRVSFFLELDPVPAEARQFVADQPSLPIGELQFADAEDGGFLRLLVELPYHQHQQISSCASAARALHAQWLDKGKGSELLGTLGIAGIAVPPLGPRDFTDLHAYGRWSWGSRYVSGLDLYLFNIDVIAQTLIDDGPFFALSHGGHGLNSYGLSLVTTAGPVAAFVQHGYGGAFMDPVTSLISINTTYSRLRGLLAGIHEAPGTTTRWLLALSTFRGAPRLVDLDRVRAGEAHEDATTVFDCEEALFDAVAAPQSAQPSNASVDIPQPGPTDHGQLSSEARINPTASTWAQGNPRDVAPSNGWLLLGDEASYPTADELKQQLRDEDDGTFSCRWTTAKQTVRGDLAFVYFVSPRKAAHFVTRAATDATFDRELGVNAVGAVANEQWWADFTPLIEIEPIPFGTLRDLTDGHLILKGRSGKFLRPEFVAALEVHPRYPQDQADLDRILVIPTGLAELPPAAEVSIDVWKSISAGALPLEAHVSSYIVEPLLRYVLRRTPFKWTREHHVQHGVVDYVVVDDDDGRPLTAIEVKLVCAGPPAGDWSKSKELRQLRRYTDDLAVPGMLIDAHRIHLVEHGADAPYRTVERRSADRSDLRAIREHILRY